MQYSLLNIWHIKHNFCLTHEMEFKFLILYYILQWCFSLFSSILSLVINQMIISVNLFLYPLIFPWSFLSKLMLPILSNLSILINLITRSTNFQALLFFNILSSLVQSPEEKYFHDLFIRITSNYQTCMYTETYKHSISYSKWK